MENRNYGTIDVLTAENGLTQFLASLHMFELTHYIN